jgi:uncharacterized protein (TIGR02646 family)
MIKIEKSILPPTVLTTRGKAATLQLIAEYESSTLARQLVNGNVPSEASKFEFDSGIYGNPTVKKQLKIDQHNKCCYCESAFTGSSYGDVEHFRPKAAYNPALDAPLAYPGYFWIAYEWTNLLFSCQICNQQFKRNHFALLHEENRAKPLAEVATISEEEPMLVDVCFENPEDHITFENEVVRPKNGSSRGTYMISVCGLDRTELVEDRERRLNEIRASQVLASIDLNDPTEFKVLSQQLQITEQTLKGLVIQGKETFATAAFRDAPFAAMIRANFPQLKTG